MRAIAGKPGYGMHLSGAAEAVRRIVDSNRVVQCLFAGLSGQAIEVDSGAASLVAGACKDAVPECS
jgi:hypothetical protein